MLDKTQRTSLLLLIGVACMAPAAFGQCPQNIPASTTYTVCMELINAGNTGGFGGVYVGPYTATINGGSPTQVICDDFTDESYIPEYWTADIISGSSGVTGSIPDLTTTRDATHNGLSSPPTPMALQQDYDEVGYLAIQLLNPNQSASTIGAIHFALWSVFNPGALTTLSVADQTAAGIQLGKAITAVNQDSGYSGYISQFTIYSPAPNPSQICVGDPMTCSNNHVVPQEFLVRTPEPPFFALLGVDLSGVGALIFLLRRRRSARS